MKTSIAEIKKRASIRLVIRLGENGKFAQLGPTRRS
jgi:hypothetical protein